ncbi:hypothetical protein AB0D59_07040 [Streptomyces sp. NPDC048417]|uniref:hypothetical protein n=1 Tax=Streptomyces sp. NPDC048417 TaxID=3155387 RepID=UPI00344549F7
MAARAGGTEKDLTSFRRAERQVEEAAGAVALDEALTEVGRHARVRAVSRVTS